MKRHLFSLSLAVLLLHPAASAQSQSAPIRVGILVYEGVYDTEFIAPLDVFHHAGGLTGGKLLVFTVSPRAGTVRTAEGLRIQADYTFQNAPAIDWLVVPSGANYKTDQANPALVGWIRKVGRKSKLVHSDCWGAFLLGAAGLLDGKQATTFPASLDEFAQRFPRVQVRRDLKLVDDAGAVTSAGGDVSFDAALYLVEQHFSLDVARRVAAGLVIDWDTRRAAYSGAAVSSARAASSSNGAEFRRCVIEGRNVVGRRVCAEGNGSRRQERA